MFSKVLVANRGEIAVRVMRACVELGIFTVAVHSKADEDALHVQMADEAVCIGAASPRESYLNKSAIISAALNCGADAIHPGYGFLAEDYNFAEICQHYDIKFIGPPSNIIALLGNKSRAREVIEEAGVKVIPGRNHITSDQEAIESARELEYPLMVKAAQGGGGRGIRLVHDDDDLLHSLSTARSEAEAAFGNGDLYMEKYLEEPRHVEVQILADEHENIVHLHERECSVQTPRHQKLLEEAPCSILSNKLRERLAAAALEAATAVGYVNAGTVEFLVDTHGAFYFMEMNTRIQVEHTVTEMVTATDLVREQLLISAGNRLGLRQRGIRVQGHAIECRITAEDPAQGFAPRAGTITAFRPPGGPGIRVDTHIYPGYTITPYYDSLICKIVVHAPTRLEAIMRMQRALDECEIEGVKTNLAFQRRIISNGFFRRGEVYTNFIQRRMADDIG